MKIAVRLDDITPDMDWQRFFAFKALLDQYQVKPLIGIVPDNRDDNLIKDQEKNKKAGAPVDFWKYVKELEQDGWTLSMHGYQHVYTTAKGGLFPLNHFSEFAGVPYTEQYRMIADGKKTLKEHGIETDMFMAPAHSYDFNTLKALRENGFKKLTDGYGKQPYQYKGLVFYPISFWLGWTRRSRRGYSTLVIHCNTISDEDIQKYQRMFEKEREKWINYSEYLEQTAKKERAFDRVAEYLLVMGRQVAGVLYSLAKRIRKK